MIGRLDPKTGEIKLADLADPEIQPVRAGDHFEGRAVLLRIRREQARERRSDNDGDPGIRSAARRQPAAADRHHARRYPLVHRLCAGLSRTLRSADRRIQGIRLAGGPWSQPYGVAFAKGAVWYSESGVRPNTLVRFDPVREDKFQSWIIPSGGGVVRNMMADHEGNIVIAESGVDRVALVEIK